MDIISKVWVYVSDPNFHTNLAANVVSDLVLGLMLYWLITQPREHRAQERRIKEILGLLKAEIERNLRRAESYAKIFGRPGADISILFPLRFTRGVWNTFKESDFILYVDDIELTQRLLEMNEAVYTANLNLRRYQLAFMEPEGKDFLELAETTREDTGRLIKILEGVLEVFGKHALPKIEFSKEFDYFTSVTQESD